MVQCVVWDICVLQVDSVAASGGAMVPVDQVEVSVTCMSVNICITQILYYVEVQLVCECMLSLCY